MTRKEKRGQSKPMSQRQGQYKPLSNRDFLMLYGATEANARWLKEQYERWKENRKNV